MKDALVIKGARQHNLKNIDLTLPRDAFIVITGLSGSGKSSLAFDTIYAEGQRRYVESLSAYARQFLGQMDKPDVDNIEGLSPAISIDQKTTSRNPRSTVGTVTEIYDYLRLLYARVGRAMCPHCHIPISQQTIGQMCDAVMAFNEGTKILILAPLVRGKRGMHANLLAQLRREGFVRVRVDGELYLLEDEIELDKNKAHNIELVVDRLVVKKEDSFRSRLADSLETACKQTDGLVYVEEVGGELHTFSQNCACSECGFVLPPIEPRLFSFNSPYGACPSCAGLGSTMEVDMDAVIPDPTVPFVDGAIAPFSSSLGSWFMCKLGALLESHGYSLANCYDDLSAAAKKELIEGCDRKLSFTYTNLSGDTNTYSTSFDGLVPMVNAKHSTATSDSQREEYEAYMSVKACRTCKGARLKPEALAVTIGGKTIKELTDMTIAEAYDFLQTVEFTEREAFIAEQVMKEIKARLGFLKNVGLQYLTLSRSAGTLSGGEAQRIRLATQIGSGLVGVLYILDEPSIGLHQRDNDRLLSTLKGLRDLGNTLLVVEHDEDTMRAADYLVDIGPMAGEGGGQVVAQGTVKEVMAVEDSITAKYLRGDAYIPLPEERRPVDKKRLLTIKKAKENNLNNVNVSFPLGLFTVVTGVSGSGKSTLVNEILYKGLAKALHRSRQKVGEHGTIEGLDQVDKVIDIDQSPIGRTPRSNPATYTGVFDPIRELYSQTTEARMRGYKAGRFSFNVKGGRCEACRGDGINKIEMHFLPDVYVPCEECKGARYNRETLEVRYKGKTIADVLDMVVDEAVEFFKANPRIYNKLKTLQDVGLGYIRLGQAATTLSGGEAQRVKLATELARRSTGRTVYILDEPTTGLHSEDIRKLLIVLDKLVAAGDTVIVIEHNLDVIKTADYIIDLGPEGGSGGGTIVATGTPEQVAKVKASYTGQFLAPVLAQTKKYMKRKK